MNFKIVSVILFISIGHVSLAFGQTNPERFVIKNVTLEGDPNPRFIRIIAESIIPWGNYTTEADVECIKSELMRTGLFSKINSRLFKLKESDGYDLVLTTKFESPDPVYKLGRIEVAKIEGVDLKKFESLLDSEHLVGSSVSLDTAEYADFVDKLYDLFKRSIVDEDRREWSSSPWLELRLNKDRELEVTVMPEFRGCSKTGP